ncbi:MAG: DUF1080 domain-containing protein [Imperialibacter sp.]|uniref:3-keto-disaccharide hydrolase n=1 Tax=Imperialibacter sp. TaxID=2038411 RepID=UPI0032EB974E
MIKLVPTLSLVVFIILFSCQSSSEKKDWQILFNGEDLSGWDTYLGQEWTQVNDSTFRPAGEPVGLNKDPKGIFSVAKVDQQNVIRISGEQWGGISTTSEFSNYHLKLQFKWGEAKHRPKANAKRDSGLLYHAVGAHGADGGFWMRSQEFQVQEGDTGDYWGVAGGVMDVPTRQEGENYIYDAAAAMRVFSEKSDIGRHATKFPDAEKPTGEWNTLELICFGDTAIHIVNGKVVMALYNSRQLTETGELPLKKGKIQLQSEGAELFYKDIMIKPISEVPEGVN